MLAVLGLGVSGLWPTILSLAGDRFPQAGASMYSLLHTSGNLGGLVSYGLSSHSAVGLSYEYINLGNGVGVQPIILSGIYSLTPDKNWTPYVRLGLGLAASNAGSSFDNPAAKAALGVEYFFTHHFGLFRRVDRIFAQQFEHHHEFITAQTRNGIPFTHAESQSLSHLLQQAVAGIVT